MFRLPEIRRIFRFPFRRPDAVAGDVDAEVEFHLAMRIRELTALGFDEAKARAEALRRFGNLAAARTELIAADRARHRGAGRADWLADLGRDLRFAARELRRNWSFTAVAVTVLGLGIGLTTAMVSLFDRLALHPLPYPNADRLAVAWLLSGNAEHSLRLNPDRDQRRIMATVPGVARVDAHVSAEAMADFDGSPEIVATRIVTVGLIDGLGGKLALGRTFLAEDSSAAAPLTTILSDETWRRRFGARADVLGRTVRIDRRDAIVVGVLRPGFDLASLDGNARADFWLPMQAGPDDPAGERATPLVTLAPGATPASVALAIGERLQAAAGPGDNIFKTFRPVLFGSNDLVASSLRRTLSLLLAAVGLVLLVACANVAALLLGQAVGRAQEFGVRAALGAGRGRVVRQLVAESVLLGGLGAGLGIGITTGVLALARRFRPERLLTIDDVHLSGATFLTAAAVALAASVGFGLAPIWALSRTDAATALVGRARRADGRGAGRLRSALVVGQIAVTLVLLIGAGLLVKSFVRLRTLPLGFESAGLAQVTVSLPEREFPGAARRERLLQDLVERVRRLPGVTAATFSGDGPLSFGATQAEFLPVGRQWPQAETKIFMPTRSASRDYFAVTGLRLVAGAVFGPDSTSADVIIDEASARRYWGSPAAAVGQRVRLGRSEKSVALTVAGVAADVRLTGDVFEGVPLLYFRAETGPESGALLVRFAGNPAPAAVSRLVRSVDPTIRIRSATTIDEGLAGATASDRFTMVIVAFFSVLSLGLAVVGVYGVIAFAVRQRHFEFGVRLAVGAVPGRIRAMVLRDGAVRIGQGVLAGLAGSLALGRVIGGMLYRMSPWDPAIFAAAAAVLAAVGVAAAWIPAARASRVDPLEAIRAE